MEAWRSTVSADLCARKGFRGVLFFLGGGGDIPGTLQLLNSGHVRVRDKALLRSVLVGGGLEWFSFGEGSGPACALSVLWWC